MQARIEIRQCFFGERFQEKDLRAFRAYFRYYDSEIDMLQFGFSPLSRQSTDLAAKTCGDILFIANQRLDQQYDIPYRPDSRMRQIWLSTDQ